MNGITVFEFDALVPSSLDVTSDESVRAVPPEVFDWLQQQCARMSDDGETAWLKIAHHRGRPAVKVTSYAGVIRAPNGFQIEVLPKVGKSSGGPVAARRLLVKMVCDLLGFRALAIGHAEFAANRMPLMEIFVGEFLRAADDVVKRGIRSDYLSRQEHLFALRGKLLVAQQIRYNLFRADRFFTEHDEFSTNRPENRLLHAALLRALSNSSSQTNQQLARQLSFAFADVPASNQAALDFQRVRLDRGMRYYTDALAWARLILADEAPLINRGKHDAPSLLFPMAALFEAYVATQLARQVQRPLSITQKARSHHLVRHREQSWFQLEPDLTVRDDDRDALVLVLDTKWKLLDAAQSNGTDKYGLSQADFYQMHAYGQTYLDGAGDVVLIYPKTGAFSAPLPVFEFPSSRGLRLWVVPFCFDSRKLLLPAGAPFANVFGG